jgi:sigma-54 dependent transcriptional regulator, acetoin dehydrogenase operon transcriptional activator AcoR
VDERARLHDEARALAAVGPGAPVDALAPRVVASWQRSQEYGVSLESVEPTFSGVVDEGSLFFQCGREVLTALHATLASEPISLMLTDADGLVLNRLSGDHSLLRALDRVHLAPGFAYSERQAGTNGLGLALADRAPSVVRAEEHYSLSLCTYTCAAAPVLDPLTGRLEGAVNLTTWSKSSSDLLLALAQSAAGNTAALMGARAQGQQPRPQPRGDVFRVETPRLEPGSGSLTDLSPAWTSPLSAAAAAMEAGRVVAAVGERGSGRATLLAQAARRTHPRDRILAAATPAPQDVESWLSLWTPELGKPHTAVLVRDVDVLPAWVAEHLRTLVTSLPTRELPFAVTAERFEDIPAPLAALVDSVVHVPPLRERSADVVPLAEHAAARARGRSVSLTAGAEHALEAHAWPGNVAELQSVVRRAATRTDVIDVRHLPPEVLSRSRHRLSRIEAFERDEIVRVLTRPEVTMKDAAEELGMSRATIYRKIAQYDIHIPR